MLRSSGGAHAGSKIWATQDRPPTLRAARNFCFGLKYLLKDDMKSEDRINVSTDVLLYSVNVGGEIAVEATVVDNQLELSWLDNFENWKELQCSPKLKDLFDKNNALLDRASAGMKGGAKGRTKDSGGSK